MQKKISLKLLPSEAADEAIIKKVISKITGKKFNEINGFNILRRSIDARAKTVFVTLTLNAYINEPFQHRTLRQFNFKNVAAINKKVIIIGAGPAGLFAALYLIEHGIKPVILERGKDVRARRRDLAVLNKDGIINPESNYCFGEGGAGTYSDGKLYTRSTKRGDIERILNLFVHFGADENILYQAHPHIGTNKLPQIITAMRQQIIACGGQFLFEKKVTDFVNAGDDKITTVRTADGDVYSGDAFILATGHSARDMYLLLDKKKILILPKPFALGVRIEHPQSLIDQIQYKLTKLPLLGEAWRGALPPATYSLAEQVSGRGVFSFCMCPGGIIAPAATNAEEIVVNGWSPSKRNNPYANSGIVVQVEPDDAKNVLKKSGINNKGISFEHNSPLLFMSFQQLIEKNAYAAGGGKFAAPAQRMVDFVENKFSSSLPGCSYLPGINSAEMKNILPEFIIKSLQSAFKVFDKKNAFVFRKEWVLYQ